MNYFTPLQTAVKPATRLRIRSGGTCNRELVREETLFETESAAEIKQFFTLIQIDEERSGGACFCGGDPSFEFYQGDRLLLTLGFHHGVALRWPGGWPGDAELTRQSGDLIIEWLANRNVTGPRTEREKAAVKAAEKLRARERKIAQARTEMPVPQYNRMCREVHGKIERDGLSCPHCGIHSRDIRILDGDDERKSYFVCRKCGRSIGLRDFEESS